MTGKYRTAALMLALACGSAGCTTTWSPSDAAKHNPAPQLAELHARYGIVALRPLPSPPAACLFAGDAAGANGYVVMGQVVDDCGSLAAPYITFDTSDPEIVAFGYAIIHGESKREFSDQLTKANATDVTAALEASRLSGAFISKSSGTLSFVTAIDGFNYRIVFGARRPIAVMIERWQ